MNSHDASEVKYWDAPERIAWLQEQATRQPFTSAWAGTMLKLIQNSKETKDEDEMKMTDMYPSKFLRGQDMTTLASNGQILVELNGVYLEKMRAGLGKPEETKNVVYFEVLDPKTLKPRKVAGLEYYEGRGYGRVLTKSLAEQIFHATQTIDTDEWKGKQVVFYPENAKAAGQPVKTVYARAPKRTATAPIELPTHRPTTTPPPPADDVLTQAVIEPALAQPPQ